MAGSQTDEGLYFTYPYFSSGMTTRQYEDLVPTWANGSDPVGSLTDDELAEVFKKYQGNFVGDKRPLAAELLTDMSMRCGTAIASQMFSTGDIFNCRFNRRPAETELLRPAGFGPLPYTTFPGVYHGLEQVFVFGDERDSTRRNRSLASECKFCGPISPSTWNLRMETGVLFQNMRTMIVRAWYFRSQKM